MARKHKLMPLSAERTGKDGDDNLRGTHGADTLFGAGGDDRLLAYKGNDRAFGQDGEDTIYAGKGADMLHGGPGDDWLYAGEGDDRLKGGSGVNRLYGSGGDDRLEGGKGENDMKGGTGNDSYVVRNWADTVTEYAYEGSDVVTVRAAKWSNSGEHIEKILLADTNFSMSDGDGDSRITGGDGRNFIDGGDGDDLLRGGGGGDWLNGGDDSNRLFGGDGNDKIGGGQGDNRMFGGAGDDMLIAGLGRDAMFGNAGADSFTFKRASAADGDLVKDFEQGVDHVDLAAVLGGRWESAFSFIADAAFSGAAGELRYEQKAGRTLLSGDTDGDMQADFTITFAGVIDFVLSDFSAL